MSVLVDTNILFRAVQLNHPQQQTALEALNILRRDFEQLCVLPQNLYEFWVAGTRPASQNGLGLSVAEAEVEIHNVLGLFRLLEEPPRLYRDWLDLVVRHRVAGKNAHDARLVAGMQVHGVDQILTLNGPHFQRFPGITVLSPQDVVNRPPKP